MSAPSPAIQPDPTLAAILARLSAIEAAVAPPRPADAADPLWAAGGIAAAAAARHLGISKGAFRALARRLKWPRKRLLDVRGIVYPRSLVVGLLAGAPAA